MIIISVGVAGMGALQYGFHKLISEDWKVRSPSSPLRLSRGFLPARAGLLRAQAAGLGPATETPLRSQHTPLFPARALTQLLARSPSGRACAMAPAWTCSIGSWPSATSR